MKCKLKEKNTHNSFHFKIQAITMIVYFIKHAFVRTIQHLMSTLLHKCSISPIGNTIHNVDGIDGTVFSVSNKSSISIHVIFRQATRTVCNVVVLSIFIYIPYPYRFILRSTNNPCLAIAEAQEKHSLTSWSWPRNSSICLFIRRSRFYLAPNAIEPFTTSHE